MGDSNAFPEAIPKPNGPSKRKPLQRMYDPIKWEIERIMAKKTNKGKNKSTPSSPTNTDPHSTPKSDSNSPRLDQEIRNRRGTSQLYPDLSEVDDSFLDESLASTSGTSSSSRSPTQTDSSYTNSPHYNQSSRTNILTSENESFTPENDWRDDNAKRENLLLNYSRNRAQSEQNSSQFPSYLILVILAILCVCGISWYLTSKSEEASHEAEKIFNKTVFRSKLIALGRLFPSQDNRIWPEFGSGISDVKTGRHRPAIFVLLAGHHETTNCLAQKVAELARDTLNGTGNVLLTPTELQSNVGEVLNFTEARMNQTKAVVVMDMLNIDPEAMRAFHWVCDEYSSLVAEAVYLFTMNSGVKDESKNLKLFVEEQLTNKFSKAIVEDTLKALIVRITSGIVLAIKEEKRIPCS